MAYRTAIVDAPFLTRRAFGATGNAGAMIGATFALLLRLWRDYDPCHLVMAWDAPKSWRKQIDPTYKAKREAPASEYVEAVTQLRTMLPIVGVAQAFSQGEADDIAWTLAGDWPGPHLLWSADKDWLQCIRKGVDVLRPDCSRRPRDVPPEEWKKPPDLLLTVGNVRELTGLSPAGWFEVLTLAGDTVDGITGLPGVGFTFKDNRPKGRAYDLHHACPDLVSRLCEGGAEQHQAIRAAAGDFAKGARWVELAIKHEAEIRQAAELVRLRDVEVAITWPQVGVTEQEMRSLGAWLAGFDLEKVYQQLRSRWTFQSPDDPNASFPF